MAEKVTLGFSSVGLADMLHYETGISGMDFSLMPGELVVVHTRPGSRRLPLADAAVGLLPPAAGRVEFLGADWTQVGPDEAARLRGRIGRVFEGTAWVNNLDLDENITLRARHHTARSLQDILAEASDLARDFGFEELPHTRPAWMEPEALTRAQWIRALLGTPELLLLEFPGTGVTRDDLLRLHEAVQKARAKGTATVWLTANPQFFGELGLTVDHEYTIVGGQWRRLRNDSEDS